MLWIKTVVHTTTAGIEPVSGILLLNGINGYEVCDSEDFNSFLENKEVYFDYIEDDLLKLKDCETTVTFYVPENSQGLETILGVKNALAGLKERDAENAFGSLAVDTDTRLEEEDWENNWKQYFHPLSIGEKFLICPSWEKVPGEGRTVIEIDPACSFGTGRHETTALCLEELEKQDIAGKDVLDMGCGSGILGIAALKLGAKHVDAVDIDMVATRIAGENAEKNGIPEGLMDIYCGNILTNGTLCESLAQNSYSLILANIVADIISDMLPFFARCLDAQGHMICSGIISPRRDFVVDALGKAGFVIESVREKNEWVAIVCRKS